MEAKVGNRVRKLHFQRLAALIIDGRKFMPISGDKIEKESSNVFMEIRSIGKVTLLEKYKIGFKTTGGSSFNPEISSVDRPFLDSDLYYSFDLKTIKKLPAGKNSILKILQDSEQKADSFMKNQ